MIPEKTLTNAEKEVLAAFRAGDKFTPDLKDEEIRSDFLRGLFCGDYEEKADYRGTRIVGAIISDVLDMEFCETKFPVRFHKCSFFQEIRLQQLTGPELDFRGCTLKNGLDALGAKMSGDVDLAKVNAMNQVRLAGADIGGQLDCTGGSFQNENGRAALHAQNVKVADGVFLCAQNIEVTAGMFLPNKFNAVGAVSLAGAKIGGQLNCTGGSFQNKGKIAFNARSIKAASEVFICNFSANGLVFFTNATIGGDLELNDCRLTHLSLASANVSGEIQDDANVYKDHKGNDIDLDIDGFRYQRLNAVKERVKDRLAWVGLMSKGDKKFRPQPYEQLMQVYRATGHTNEARDVGFELEQKRREKMEWGWRKIWYSVLRFTIGYGYKPFRILWWFPLAIVGGFLLFSGALCPQKWTSAYVFMSTLGNGITEQSECERWRMIPSDVEALLSPDWRDGKIAPEGYPKFIPFFYAIEVALPVLALGQTGNWQPKSLFIKWIQGIIIIFGAVALAVPASYRTGILSPRWWDE